MNISDFPGQIKCILDASVRTQAIQGRVPMDSIPEAEAIKHSLEPVLAALKDANLHIPLGVFLCHNLVDEPLRDIQYLGWRVITNEVLYSLQVLFFRWLGLEIAVAIREQDEHPFIPWLYHPYNAHPSKLWMLAIGLHDPMKIPLSILNQMR
jgi:hypothetical protein